MLYLLPISLMLIRTTLNITRFNKYVNVLFASFRQLHANANSVMLDMLMALITPAYRYIGMHNRHTCFKADA